MANSYRKKILLLVSCIIIALILARPGYAQQINPATGGTGISADDAAGGSLTTLSGPVITETSSGQISLGFITFTLPDGYEWDTTGAEPTVTVTLAPGQNGNTHLEIVFSSRTTDQIEFEVTSTSDEGPRRPGEATFSGLRVRPTQGSLPNAGFITNIGSSAPGGNINYGDLSMVAGAPAKIRMETEADGTGNVVPSQNLTAGNSLTVYAISRDQFNNYLQNIAADSWSIINETGGVTAADLTVAGDNKSAVFSSTDTGTGQIQATKSGLSSTPSETISVKAADPATLTLQTQPSSTATAGQAFAQQPVLYIRDIYGNRVMDDFNTQVTAARKTGTGLLQGTTTKLAEQGVVTFTDLSHNIADTISIEFTSPGFASVISNTIVITPAAANQLTFTRQPPNSSKNSVLDPPPIVQIQDTFGNDVAQSGVNITMTTASGPTNFSNSSTIIVTTDALGKAIFTNLILGVNGAYTLQAAASGLTSATSNSFQIIDKGTLAKFEITTTSDSPIGSQTAGQSFTIKINALDGTGSLLDGTGQNEYTRKAFVFSIGNTGLGLNDSTANFSRGVVTHTVAAQKAGEFTISVTGKSSAGDEITSQSNKFTVNPASANSDSSTISAAPVNIVANGSSTALITVQLNDQFGNNVTQGGDNVVISATAGTLLASVSDNGDGTYTQELQSNSNAQTVVISATANGDDLTDSATVNFTSGGLDHFAVQNASGGNIATQNAGQPFTIQIIAQDVNNNTVTDFNGSVNITSNKTIAAGAGTVSLTNGVLNNYSITTRGAGQNNVTITATNTSGSETGVSNIFTVNPGPADPTTTTITAANRFIENTGSTMTIITVQAKDQYGNNRISGGQTVTISTTAGTLQGSVSDNGDGTYTQTLQSSTTVTTATITGTIAGNTITDQAKVSFAEFNEWTSGGGGPNATTWSDGGNWTFGTPTATQAIFIPEEPAGEQQFPIIKSTNPTIAFLVIEDGATLNVNPGQSISITSDVSGDGTLIVDEAAATIAGDITIANLNAGSSTVTLNGTDEQLIPGSLITNILNIENTSSGGISSDGYVNAAERLTVTNSTLTMESGSTFDVFGDVTGNGVILSDNATFIIGGDVTIDSIDVSNSDVTFDPSFDNTGLQTINNIPAYRNLTVNNLQGVIHNSDAAISETLTINAGSSFEVTGDLSVSNMSAAGGTLKLQSDFSAADVTSAPATVEFTGGNPQELIDFETFNNLTVNKSANDLLSTSNVIINGTLTLTNGNLVMASGTNLLAPNRSLTGGEIKFQLELPSKGWYMMSSPVAALYNDFLDSVVTQGFPGAFYSTGSAPGDTLQPNVLFYDETYEGTDNQRWRTITAASNSVGETLGHFVFVFGDVPNSSLYDRATPRILEVGGAEFTGSGSEVNFNVTYSPEGDTTISGFNLVGNPYGATIDWDDNAHWTKTSLDNTIYVWDHTANGGHGAYLVWNGFTGSLGNGLIAPFQGFWVKANDANPTLAVQEDVKTVGGVYRKETSTRRDEQEHASIELKLTSGEFETKAYIAFSSKADRYKDPYDAYRLTPFTDTFLKLFTTLGGGTQLVINNLPIKFGKEIEIPIYIGGYNNGNPITGGYTLSWPELSNVPDEWKITLIDNITGQEIEFSGQEFYSFDVRKKRKSKANAGIQKSYTLKTKSKSNEARFVMRINPGAAADDLPRELVLYQNYANPFTTSTKIEFGLPLQSDVKLVIYDILGRRINLLTDQQYAAGYYTIPWNPQELASGVYLYVLMADGKMLSNKMTYIK